MTVSTNSYIAIAEINLNMYIYYQFMQQNQAALDIYGWHELCYIIPGKAAPRSIQRIARQEEKLNPALTLDSVLLAYLRQNQTASSPQNLLEA